MRTLTGLLRVVGCLAEGGRGPRRALDALATEPHDRALAKLAGEIGACLTPGVLLSTALARSGRAPAVVVEIVRRGEALGQPAIALARAAAWLERSADARDRVWSAIFAPGRIAVPLFGFALWIGVMVAPCFRSLFDTMNVELPGVTKLALEVALFAGDYWGQLLVLASLVAMLLRRCPGAVARVVRSLPIVRRHWRAWALAEFARALAWTLQAGVPLPDALVCAAAASGDPDYRRCVAGALPRVLAGESAAEALAPAPWDAGFAALFAEGEATGVLPDLLARTCDVRDRMVGRDLERAAVRLELLALSALALLGFLALVAMLMPVLPHHCCCG